MKTLFKLTVVGVAQAVLASLLYRQRVLSESEIWDSDFLLFGLPTLIALLFNAWIIGNAVPNEWRPGLKGVVTTGLSLLATSLAMWAFLVFALNRYGS